MSGFYQERDSCHGRHLRVLKNVLSVAGIMSVTKCALFGALLSCCTSVFAQSVSKEPKEVAVVELGGAVERSLTEGTSSFGPTAAVEVTPIENWLELEAGVTPLFRRHSTEWSVDFFFKNPWTISHKMQL